MGDRDMRVLWICNVVLNDFADAYGIKKKPFGGWMEGMLHAIEKYNKSNKDTVEVSLAFPICNEIMRHDGVHGGHRYYSFDGTMDQRERFACLMENAFVRILNVEKPDTIHVWGTEYPHARAAVEAAKKCNMAGRIIVHIQGLVSVCALHYALGVPEEYLDLKSGDFSSMREAMESFRIRGEDEKAVLRDVRYILGRTDWDRACARLIAPNVEYRFCEEIYRDAFYNSVTRWSPKDCARHTIFMSQAGYPIKGIHFVVKAAAMVRRFYPDLHIYVAGGNILQPNKNGNIDPYGRYIQALMLEYDVMDVFDFLGNLEAAEMMEQYLRANVFVSASTVEDTSNSVCEAMMLGTPVVASYVGGVTTSVEHKKTGFLYPCDEPYMLADYVMRIFEDDKLAVRLSCEASKVMTVRHDREKILQQLLGVYGEIVQRL